MLFNRHAVFSMQQGAFFLRIHLLVSAESTLNDKCLFNFDFTGYFIFSFLNCWCKDIIKIGKTPVGMLTIGQNNMNDLIRATELLQLFRGNSFPDTVSAIEKSFVGANKSHVLPFLIEKSLNDDLLYAALLIKRNASQIDEIVHTLGILLALPSILDQNERIEALSLAAGNTGKGFDLETDKRIAEFTFIQWQGGPEVIRQNKIFKDFYFLAESETSKLRQLYVIGTDHVLKFFNSKRSLRQILDGNAKLGSHFREHYGTKFHVVSDYYQTKKDVVCIKDIRSHLVMMKNL